MKGSSGKYNRLLRESKIMTKLSGERISGSKKRWFPSQNDAESGQRRYNLNNIVFRAQNIGSLNNEENLMKAVTPPKKNTNQVNSRRMNVLNKLFMEQISSLLATGEISEEILGKGLQVSRVRISHDFSQLSVYWSAAIGSNFGINSTIVNNILEKELQKCSGILRHQLSQLCLMGRVPRITFVRDTFQNNLLYVDELLKGLNLEKKDYINEDSNSNMDKYNLSSSLKESFFGLNATTETTEAITLPQHNNIEDVKKLEANNEEKNLEMINSLPAMRHDVFGLDHKEIMLKILGKMRKSKQAWEKYNQETQTINDTQVLNSVKPSNDLESSAKTERLQAYLDKCRKTANKTAIPSRKKLRRTMPGIESFKEDESEDYFLSEQQQQMYESEDFSEDDEFNDKNDKYQ